MAIEYGSPICMPNSCLSVVFPQGSRGAVADDVPKSMSALACPGHFLLAALPATRSPSPLRLVYIPAIPKPRPVRTFSYWENFLSSPAHYRINDDSISLRFTRRGGSGTCFYLHHAVLYDNLAGLSYDPGAIWC